VSAATIDAAGKGKEEQLAKLTGGKVKDISKETDVNVLKNLVSEFPLNDTIELRPIKRHSSTPLKWLQMRPKTKLFINNNN